MRPKGFASHTNRFFAEDFDGAHLLCKKRHPWVWGCRVTSEQGLKMKPRIFSRPAVMLTLSFAKMVNGPQVRELPPGKQFIRLHYP